MHVIKSARLLAENVAALLEREHLSQTDLAQWCRKSDPWVSQFLRGERTWRMADLDRVADLFGLQAYQLFIPGVSQRTERRSGVDRRTVKDRRVGKAQQFMMNTAKEIDGHHPRRRAPYVAASSPLMEALDRIAADTNKRITAALRQFAAAGERTPRAGDAVPDALSSRRTARPADAPRAKKP